MVTEVVGELLGSQLITLIIAYVYARARLVNVTLLNFVDKYQLLYDDVARAQSAYLHIYEYVWGPSFAILNLYVRR